MKLSALSLLSPATARLRVSNQFSYGGSGICGYGNARTWDTYHVVQPELYRRVQRHVDAGRAHPLIDWTTIPHTDSIRSGCRS
ncbi:hypothetical protein BJY01DRAFT_220198 [Aspergillus pseudoustus]|uniref:Uncharacterized protein n=1 Tax=Aspergillus pseudoustus TaxID=1810923 RepID=A0ABR4JDQ7_9EURO